MRAILDFKFTKLSSLRSWVVYEVYIIMSDIIQSDLEELSKQPTQRELDDLDASTERKGAGGGDDAKSER